MVMDEMGGGMVMGIGLRWRGVGRMRGMVKEEKVVGRGVGDWVGSKWAGGEEKV